MSLHQILFAINLMAAGISLVGIGMCVRYRLRPSLLLFNIAMFTFNLALAGQNAGRL